MPKRTRRSASSGCTASCSHRCTGTSAIGSETFTWPRTSPRKCSSGRWPAWLFTIARNAVVDERRQRRSAAELEAADLVEHLWVDSPEHAAEQREEWRRLVAFIGGLSDRERELLGLKFAAGLTNREISQVLNLSENNVSQIAHRAIAKLRRRFDEEIER
jgi:RNA polymerase sigma factor (sigma-70 family)